MDVLENGKVRKHIAVAPTHPLEPAGTVVLPGNVKHTVEYREDGAKVTTWDYRDATF